MMIYIQELLLQVADHQKTTSYVFGQDILSRPHRFKKDYQTFRV